MSGQLTYEVMDLLCSRLCHDLISPVGAINNGVELIEDLGDDMVGEAVGLIAQSGRRAAGRLRCFRLCYGAAGSQASVSLDEARGIADGYLEGGKVALDWNVGADWGTDGPPAGTVKVLLNLLIVADEALSQGGRISVTLEQAGGTRAIVVRADGPKVALRDNQDAALDGELAVEELGARNVQAYVTGLFADRFGLPVGHAVDASGALRLQLTLS